MNNKNIDSLTKIMDEEISNFKQLLKYEKLKNDVIINQEAEKLKQLTYDEEEILDKVAHLEKKRGHIVENLFKEYDVNSDKVLSSLIKVLPDTDKNYKEIISKQKEELMQNIKDLKKINKINNKLLEDSIDFFNYAVNSIQDIDKVVYDKNGTTPKDFDNSWLINKRA